MKDYSAQIHSTLKTFFGYDTFKGDQEQVINHLLNGGDAFVLMPTGEVKASVTSCPPWWRRARQS